MRASVYALAAVAGLSAVAHGGITGDPVRFQVTGADGDTASWGVNINAAPWVNGQWRWNSNGPIEMRSQSTGNVVARIENLSLFFDNDPVVTVNFAVTASNVNTTFIITSGLLNFPAFPALARATASATVTDSNGDGAFVNGLYGGDLYRANYNGAIPGPTQFTTLLPSMGAGSFGGNSNTQSTPGIGFVPIGVTSSMQASFAFTLSANDQASGTSTFVTIPTPGGMIVLAMAGVAAGRRRR